MFKQMGRAGMPGSMNPMDFMGAQPNLATRSLPKACMKTSKDKRKSQKLARKKNKKRK